MARIDGVWPRPLAEGRAVILLVPRGAVTADHPLGGTEVGPGYELAIPARRDGLLRRADIELDPQLHTARRSGRSLQLSAKEFAVLEALMGTRAILSAEDILEQVWDEHADPFTNTVKVTISRLRKKLGGPPLIENIARVGYRLSDTFC